MADRIVQTVGETTPQWLADQLDIPLELAERFLYSPAERFPDARLTVLRGQADVRLEAVISLSGTDMLMICKHQGKFVTVGGMTDEPGPGDEHFSFIVSETVEDDRAVVEYARQFGNARVERMANVNLAILKGMAEPYGRLQRSASRPEASGWRCYLGNLFGS